MFLVLSILKSGAGYPTNGIRSHSHPQISRRGLSLAFGHSAQVELYSFVEEVFKRWMESQSNTFENLSLESQNLSSHLAAKNDGTYGQNFERTLIQ